MGYLKDGESWSFPKDFGFTGSATRNVSPRAHPTMSQDEFGDDAQLAAEAKVPTFADGGPTAGAVGKKMPKAGKAILGALQLGKTIGMVQAAKGAAAGAAPPAGSMPNAAAPGLGPLPRPGAGVIPGALPGQAPGMKKGGKAKWASKAFKPSHKGRLHRALGVPEGEKIPAEKMESALHSKDEHVQHMARAAHNINK